MLRGHCSGRRSRTGRNRTWTASSVGAWSIWLHGLARIRHQRQPTDPGPGTARHGFRKLTAHPQHYAQDPVAIEAFKKLPQPGPRHPHPRRFAAGRNLVPGRSPDRASKSRSPDVGPGVGAGPARRTISAQSGHTSSLRSARRRARAQSWSCHGPTPTLWANTST